MLFSVCFSWMLHAQTPKQFLKKANEAYKNEKYAEAAALYEQGILHESKPDILTKCAESHLKSGNYKQAYERYTSLLNSGKVKDPSIALSAATAASKSGHFEDAIKWYSLQKPTNPNDSVSIKLKTLKMYTDSFAISENLSLNDDNGRCVEIDASASIDQLNKDLVFEWDFGDGTVKQGVRTEHCYEKDGVYTIQLATIDKKSFLRREKDTSIVVTIRSSFLNITGKTDVKPNVAYTYLAKLNAPSEWVPVDYFWDFEEEGKAAGTKVVHIFKTNKSYKVSLSVVFKNSEGNLFIKTGYVMVNCASAFDKSETLLEIEKQGGKGK